MSEQVWVPKMGGLFLNDKQRDYSPTLEVGIYELCYQDFLGFYLQPKTKSFEFPYKLYGLEVKLVERALNYFNKTDSGNLGMLLNGVKGTGKTVTSKILCNKLHMPVILVSNAYNGAENYINSIPQDIVVLIDEYEKIYKESHDLLTIMDGALNSIYRRVFLMTTNNLYIDSNLIDRPSRVRYLKTFSNLSPEIVEDIVDDLLVYTEFREDCIQYISTLEIITVDIVKAVLSEVNIQNESPNDFKSVFNATTKKGKYKLFTEVNGEIKPFMTNVKISPRPNFGDHTINSSLYINDEYVGRIKEVVDFNTIKFSVFEEEVEVEEGDLEPKNDSQQIISVELSLTGGRTKRSRKAKEEPKTKTVTRFDLPKGEVTLIVQDDFAYNDTYKYGQRKFVDDEFPYM
jgi:DNA-directed RNA polymerase subunit F